MPAQVVATRLDGDLAAITNTLSEEIALADTADNLHSVWGIARPMLEPSANVSSSIVRPDGSLAATAKETKAAFAQHIAKALDANWGRTPAGNMQHGHGAAP